MLGRLLIASTCSAAATVLVLVFSDRLEELARQPAAGLLVRVLEASGWALAAGVALAGWQHQRSRIVFAALVVGSAAWMTGAVAAWPEAQAEAAVRALLVLVGLCFAWIGPMEERGLSTRAGLPRLLGLLAVLGGAGWLLLSRRAAAPAALAALEPATRPLADTPLTPLSLGLGLAAAGLSLFSRRRDRLEVGPALTFTLLCATLGLLASSGRVPRLDAPLSGAAYFVAAASTLALALHLVAWRSGHVDELTGLPSRRALAERLARLGGRYTLAVLDLDRFKRVNDRHGHEAGDAVLRAVGHELHGFSPGTFHRSGGEEFVATCPGRRLEAVKEALEELRRSIEALRIAVPALPGSPSPAGRPGRPLRVTASIGAAERSARDRTPERVLAAADAALLRAKRGGRNRVEVEKRGMGERARRRRMKGRPA